MRVCARHLDAGTIRICPGTEVAVALGHISSWCLHTQTYNRIVAQNSNIGQFPDLQTASTPDSTLSSDPGQRIGLLGWLVLNIAHS